MEPPEFLVMVRERDSLVPGDDVVVDRQNGLGIDSHPRNLELETRDDDDKMRLETKYVHLGIHYTVVYLWTVSNSLYSLKLHDYEKS